jgi:hypothetical protein
VRNRRVLRDRHYLSEPLFQHTLTVGIRDSDAGDGRLVRHKWAGLDSDLPAAGKRCPRNDNIRFRLPSKNLAQGDLVLRVRDERSNATRHQL